tara:strand:- start:2545 stop:3099 length:555 start_codon:yes stop_codon:yes gene_type:complete
MEIDEENIIINEQDDICFICLDNTNEKELINFCKCKLKAHVECLETYINKTLVKKCNVCNYNYKTCDEYVTYYLLCDCLMTFCLLFTSSVTSFIWLLGIHNDHPLVYNFCIAGSVIILVGFGCLVIYYRMKTGNFVWMRIVKKLTKFKILFENNHKVCVDCVGKETRIKIVDRILHLNLFTFKN